jgi:nitrite reductase/ring-hydroxylating ferredoxin subunit
MLRLLDLPSTWRALDPLAARLRTFVQKVLPPSRPVDALHGTPIGHPAHPPLAQAALSGWTAAALLGAAELVSPRRHQDPAVHNQRDLLALAGLAGAAPTVLTGWADWSDLHEDQQRTGLVHAATMATTAGLSLAARLTRRPRTSALLDVAVGVIATVGASLGGHLSFRWAAGPNHAEAFPHLAKEGWTRVCRSDDLTDDRPVLAMLGDEPVVVVRHGSTTYAMADRCSHLAGPLHEGEVTTQDGSACLVCPWHGSTFALDDGSVARGPAAAPQPVLDVRIVAGEVEVRPRPLPGVAGR